MDAPIRRGLRQLLADHSNVVALLVLVGMDAPIRRGLRHQGVDVSIF
jgi:hypothetical protein